MGTTTPELGVVGDIGATNARFALVDESGAIGPPRLYRMDDYSDLLAVLDAFWRDSSARPQIAALAVAAPVTGDVVSFTNRAWSFETEAVRRRFGLRRLHVVNDFSANALAIPALERADYVQIGPGAPSPDAAVAILGPGTGLGVSGLIPSAETGAAIEGEGGHVTLAAATEQEAAVIALVRNRFGHVSAERLLSGPGLVILYQALCALSERPAQALTPAQVTDAKSQDPCAREATSLFCAMLGTVAGNLALTLGARGGVYLAGGIAPKLIDRLKASDFRARFEAKGRFSAYLAATPTYVITRPLPALLGAARLLREEREQAPRRASARQKG